MFYGRSVNTSQLLNNNKRKTTPQLKVVNHPNAETPHQNITGSPSHPIRSFKLTIKNHKLGSFPCGTLQGYSTELHYNHSMHGQ